MKIIVPISTFLKTALVLSVAVIAQSASDTRAATVNWPQFRGPDSSGVSDDPAPVTWNVESGENVRWQTPIAGLGHSCPIVWQNHIYLTSAVRAGAHGSAEVKIGIYGDVEAVNESDPEQWHVLCLDKATGKILWDKIALESIPKIKRHTKSSHCNSTPVTDGERIVALFGSQGMYCFDMGGRELWHKDLGPMDAGWYYETNTPWGFGSSPLLHEGKIIVQCDVVSEQYLAAFDARDGTQLWRTARKDVPTWSTPVIATSGGHTQIIVNGWKEIGGYDFNTGHRLWTLSGGGDIPVASPILNDQCVILSSAHGAARPLRAVRLDATGDITPAEIGGTNQAIVWSQPRKGNYLQTPIVAGGLLFANQDGVLNCLDPKTGKMIYNERIGGGNQGFTASPVAADGKIYFPGEQGEVYVLSATNQFTVLATNKLGDLCLASPAISEGSLYFRTTSKLVAVGFKK